MSQKIFSPRQGIPGSAVGFKSMDDVHSFNNSTIRRKGFVIRTGTGNNLVPIQLPGTSKFLLGLLLLDTSGDGFNVCNLVINNDSRIEQVSTSSLCRVLPSTTGPAVASVNAYDEEYFPVPTPLSGNDTITLELVVRTAGEVYITIYYI